MLAGCGWRRRHRQRHLGLRYNRVNCDWPLRLRLLRLELPNSWANCDLMRPRRQRHPGHPSNLVRFDLKLRHPRQRLRHPRLGADGDCLLQLLLQRLPRRWLADFYFVFRHVRRRHLRHRIGFLLGQILPAHHRTIADLDGLRLSLRTNCRREVFRLLVFHHSIVRHPIYPRRHHGARHRRRIP